MPLPIKKSINNKLFIDKTADLGSKGMGWNLGECRGVQVDFGIMRESCGSWRIEMNGNFFFRASGYFLT